MRFPTRPVLVVLALLFCLPETWAEPPAVKKKLPPGLNVPVAGKSGVTPVRRRRRRCAPENRAQCGGQEVGPIIATNQAADIVLGQPDFTTTAAVPPSARSFGRPNLLGADGTLLVVGDPHANRVLLFQPSPVAIHAPAQRVLGQPSPTTNAVGAAPGQMNIPQGGAAGGGKLVVADTGNHRVLVFSGVPATDGAAPALVLGQSGASGCSPTHLAFPYGVWTDGSKLVVAEMGNHRVLVWRTFPTRSGQPPDVVLGQPNLTTCAIGAGRGQLARPMGVGSDGRHLFVADQNNNRVVVYTDFASKEPGAAPDVILGGSAGISATSTTRPIGIVVHDGALFVSDAAHRVLVWDALPTADGQPATHVLGQPHLTSAAILAPSATSMDQPAGLAIAGDRLWVADGQRARVLGFPLYP